MKNKYLNTRGLGLVIGLAAASLSAQAQMPSNLDFGSNNFSNWTTLTGFSTTGSGSSTSVIMTSITAGAPVGGVAPGSTTGVKSRHATTSGTATDHYGGFPIVCPAGPGFSARVGNDDVGAQADRIQYFVHVPMTSTSYNVQYQYAVVLQDAGHPQNMQTSFQVRAYDSATGLVIPGANNMYIARYVIPGFFPYTNPVTSVVDSMIAWMPWTASTINLSGMGGKTVVIECTALDCAAGGHWGYGYFDVTSVQDSLVASALRYNTAGDSVVLEGPPGYKSYRYYNQNFSQALTAANDPSRTRTVVAPLTAQYYNLVITPYDAGGVADTIRTPVLRKKGLGVGNTALQATKLYPNPASEKLQLEFAAPFKGSIEIRNANGALVWTGSQTGSTRTEIPVATLPGGMYTLKMQDAAGATEVRQVSVVH